MVQKKRSRKPLKGAGSSGNFDRTRFVSTEAQKRFEQDIIKKSFILERGIQCRELYFRDIYALIDFDRWWQFV